MHNCWQGQTMLFWYFIITVTLLHSKNLLFNYINCLTGGRGRGDRVLKMSLSTGLWCDVMCSVMWCDLVWCNNVGNNSIPGRWYSLNRMIFPRRLHACTKVILFSLSRLTLQHCEDSPLSRLPTKMNWSNKEPQMFWPYRTHPKCRLFFIARLGRWAPLI